MKYRFIFLSLFLINLTFAQDNTQNIRGIVVDKFSQSAIIGATIQVVNNGVSKGAASDDKGQYVIAKLSPGRYEMKVTYMGYKEVNIPNIVISSGKEVIMDISMEEDLRQLNQVLIKSMNKANTVNNLATISARTFSMEEVNRYAGVEVILLDWQQILQA
jgi:hypothetical protein